jgi:hypothetical protein
MDGLGCGNGAQKPSLRPRKCDNAGATVAIAARASNVPECNGDRRFRIAGFHAQIKIDDRPAAVASDQTSLSDRHRDSVAAEIPDPTIEMAGNCGAAARTKPALRQGVTLDLIPVPHN